MNTQLSDIETKEQIAKNNGYFPKDPRHVAILAGVNLLIGGSRIVNKAIQNAPPTEFSVEMRQMVGEISASLLNRIAMCQDEADRLSFILDNPPE